MKTPTKKLEILPEDILTKLEETKLESEKMKYTATITMGSLFAKTQGNDETIFAGLAIPKVTGKCVISVKNNDTSKTFEAVLAPFMAKKILTNTYVQKFQWKRFLGKVS